jgi:hypothetical protein
MIAFDAKSAGDLGEKKMQKMGIDWVTFNGLRIQYRSMQKGDHYRIIVAAMRAKLDQDPKVREILFSTGDLKLRPDHYEEKNAPPEWRYFEIWMELRSELKGLPAGDRHR